MSDPTNASTAVTGGAVQGASTTTQTGSTSTGVSAETVSSMTSINSMADLKAKAPSLYNAMMQGLATNICNDIQHAQERLKKAMRDGQQMG